MIWIQPRCSFEQGTERCAQEPRHELEVHVQLGAANLVVEAKLCDEHRAWFFEQPNVERTGSIQEVTA